MIKEMMSRIQRSERNPSRWANFGGQYFQWKDKTNCQRMIDLMISYIGQMESANKELVEKNNGLLQKLSPVVEAIPEQPSKNDNAATQEEIQPQSQA